MPTDLNLNALILVLTDGRSHRKMRLDKGMWAEGRSFRKHRRACPDSSWHLSVFGDKGSFQLVWREHLPWVLTVLSGGIYEDLPTSTTLLLLKFPTLIIHYTNASYLWPVSYTTFLVPRQELKSPPQKSEQLKQLMIGDPDWAGTT